MLSYEFVIAGGRRDKVGCMLVVARKRKWGFWLNSHGAYERPKLDRQ